MGLRGLSQEAFRRTLLYLNRVDVTVHGELPPSDNEHRYIIASYPHSDHGDSLLLSSYAHKLIFLAAKDHWYQNSNPLMRTAMDLVVPTSPLSRTPVDENGEKIVLTAKQEEKLNQDRAKESEQIGKALADGFKIWIHVQGSRKGRLGSLAEMMEVMGKLRGTAAFAREHNAKIIPAFIRYTRGEEVLDLKKDGMGILSETVKAVLKGHLPEPIHADVYFGEPIEHGSARDSRKTMLNLAVVVDSLDPDRQDEVADEKQLFDNR